MTWVYICLFLFAWCLSAGLTPLMIKAAHKFNFLDHPGGRKIHKNPHPLLGGAAIFFSFQITIFLSLLLVWYFSKTSQGQGESIFTEIANLVQIHGVGIKTKLSDLLILLAGGWLCFVIGLIDDKIGISPRTKLVVQIIASLMLIFAGFKFDVLSSIPLFGPIITIFWIVFIANAFNLLDNMDGLSAGVAAICLLFFVICNYQLGQFFLVSFMLVLLGAILGFLPYNMNPSKIFMGDAGSLFIGYTIAALTVLSTFYDSSSPTPLAITKPLVILAVPAFDTLSVIAIRLKRGLPIFQGDKNHFSHRLVAIGMPQKNAVLFIYLVTFCTGLGATLLQTLDVGGGVVILAQVIIIFSIIVLLERIRQ